MEKELQVVTVPRGTRKTVLALDMQELTTEMGLGGGNQSSRVGCYHKTDEYTSRHAQAFLRT